VVFDQAGNLYGADDGGPHSCGLVFQMTNSGGYWTLNDIYDSFYCPNGSNPIFPGGLIVDSAGDIYGVTHYGGTGSCPSFPTNGCGTIFKLTRSWSGWVGTTLYNFNQNTDGGWVSAPVLDAAGNLYGGTELGGTYNAGTIWELSPSNGGWTFTVLYNFQGTEGGGPAGKLAIDAAGTLYGTTNADDSYYYGNVWKLTPSSNGWIYTDLHDFTGGADGGGPLRGVTLDGSGNIYGTAPSGGRGFGVIFEITP
jgi:uncharacterized repeat protein (TIGR03803 family)